MSVDWEMVAKNLEGIAKDAAALLDNGQRASIMWMAEHLPQSGVVLADEVGTGKTRIACAVVHAVLEAGGRAAVVVPHGLMHQWIAESRKLCASSPSPKELTTFTEFLRKGFSPQPDESEWWLISHGFRAPLVRNNSSEWRVALPAFVDACLSQSESDNRKKLGKLQHAMNPDSYPDDVCWNGMVRIAREVASHICGRQDLLERIKALPPLNVSSWNNDALLEQFGNSGDGRPLTEELLGFWLGEFDLLVIDEAHKNRGEVDIEDASIGSVSGSVLSRLVNKLLRQPEAGRRLCVTATPMELDLDQWLHLLGRERACSGLRVEDGKRVIAQFREATITVAIVPDEVQRLEDLKKAAKEFETALAPYVTRRRRTESELIKKFQEKLVDDRGQRPHPHRNVKSLSIGWTETAGQNSPWLDVLFAAECMSQSARGLTIKDTEGWPRTVRDAYTKLSAGHVSIDLAETSEPIRIPDPGAVDDQVRAKIARVAYWYRWLCNARKNVLDGFLPLNGAELDPDVEHPRILAAVKEIENWTMRDKPEKVLVFGVFLRPLHLLADVLNVRRALRDADQERPIYLNFFPEKKHGEEQSNRARHLLGIAFRQLDRLRGEGALSGCLINKDTEELKSALVDSHEKYKRLRDKVRDLVKNQINSWCTDPHRLKWIKNDKAIVNGIEKHLIAFLVDEYMASPEVVGDAKLTEEFWGLHIASELADAGGDDDKEDARVKRLRDAFCDDDNLHMRNHAVLLQGENRWSTRRYVQAAFNREKSSPQVLIAQSQVGREGLNLHESCRVVVQFHAEWNPAILEQQIGRVDRKGSLWERLAQKWIDDGARGEPPFVEVRQLIFEGTYDAFQWDRVTRRQHVFDASLFGSLLPADAWQRVPRDRLEDLLSAAPSFRPKSSE